MRRNGHISTSGLKFDAIFDFPVPNFREILVIIRSLGQFLLNRIGGPTAHAHKLPFFSTFGQICNPKFDICMVSTTKFSSACGKIHVCSERKTAFAMQNLENLGGRGKGYRFLV